MQTRMKTRSLRRGVATVVAMMSVLQLQMASGAPGDIFSIAAPTLGADPPKASDIKAGDASVSTQTGAVQYSYSVTVPPGRNGMAPSLALSYSSQAPTYGGIASGWTLSIPSISEDRAHGRLATRSGLVDAQIIATGRDPGNDDTFVSSLAGGRPLVQVTEPTGVASDVYLAYRAQNDDGFARYERMNASAPYRWRVRTTDGKVMTFGEAARMPGCVVSDQNAPLTGTVDAYGNEVSYLYRKGTANECVIDSISWGQNAAAGLNSFASVKFDYKIGSLCNGSYSNSQIDYRTGVRIVTGASRLGSITVTAYKPGASGTPLHTRRVTLEYDQQAEQCNQTHAPVRLLKTIRESASGVDSPLVTLPPIDFEYNAPGVTLITPQTNGYASAPWSFLGDDYQNLGWGYRSGGDLWPSVESMFLDVDGDGLQDIVTNASNASGTTSECVATWHKNLGPQPDGSVGFAGVSEIALPRLKWHGKTLTPDGSQTADTEFPNFEGCALNGQVTAYRNAYGLPGVCHHEPGASCVSGSDPLDDHLYCGPGRTRCPKDPGGPAAGETTFRTYLAYRWLDMDGDGLTDLVAAVHGDIDSYDIERGNEPGFTAGEPSIWGIPGLNEWPSCKPTRDIDTCKSVEKCFDGRFARICSDGNGCTYDWTQILQCVSQSTGSGCSNYLMKPAGGTGGPSLGVQRHPYERCEGLHPWFIYWNQGKGNFAQTPTIKYQPVPLESSSGDSSLGGGQSVTSESHAIIDFDGDGILDVVVRPTSGDVASGWVSGADWQVWLGDGKGGFGPKRYMFPTRTMQCPPAIGDCSAYGGNALTASGNTWGRTTLSLGGLLDINGDGALDHWLAYPAQGNANIAFNNGEQLRLNGSPVSIALGEVNTAVSLPTYAVKPGNDTHVTSTKPTYPFGPNVRIEEGFTTAANRVVDVDGDGRQDVVAFATPTATPIVHFNVGENFVAAGLAYGSGMAGVNYDGLRRRTDAFLGSDAHATAHWQLSSDLIDLDGDGIAESLYFTPTDGFRRARPQSAQPPRLLKAVHNGRGSHSSITYAQMHDLDVVSQDPNATWPDRRPKASPRAGWVVKSIQSRDDISNTTATMQYFYRNPRYGADTDAGGSFSFRGFEEVTTTKPGRFGNPDGARSVQRYAYDVDASGRLVESIVMPSKAEGVNDARSIDRTTWQMLPLFGGALRTYQPSASEHYTCLNGQSEDVCLRTPAGHTRTTSTYTTYPLNAPAGQEQLWVESESRLQAGAAPANGDRRTLSTYYLKSGSDNYVLRPQDSTQQSQLAGLWTTYAKTRHTWTTIGAPVTDEVWVDNDERDRAITRYDIDAKTGNRLAVWKPEQWAANPDTMTNETRTVYKYDDRELFVAAEINELGHTREFVYEYGTGTKLQTLGPNKPLCILWGFPCTAGALTTQVERVRIDGLGRTIERYSTFAESGYDFAESLVERNTYVDGTSSYVIHENAIDQNRFGKDRTDLDGHGRPIRKTQYALGAAPADSVTTYIYNSDGTLARVTLPDPTKNDASVVTYTYYYDSLSRPTVIRRADNQTGMELIYDGLVQSTREILGNTTGKQAVTKTTKDSLGRLVSVDEKLATGYATTLYGYDADDNVTQITDPTGVTTTLQHDFAGRRTQISRAGRIWSYTYDRNGNMQTETSPCTGLGCEALYTTSFVYDALDRPTSKSVAPRDLSPADLATFGGSTEKFTYDSDANAIGKLVHWQSFAPNATDATNEIWRSWNLQGQRNGLYESFNGAGYQDLGRSTSSSYELSGALSTERYNDGITGGDCETGGSSLIRYDARGLPSATWIFQCPQQAGAYSLVYSDRNVAGLVTKRYSSEGSGPFTYVESNWRYDILGRVTGQTITRGNPQVQVARQDIAYNGNDDPKTLDHWLDATNHKQFTFDYDTRHQLTSVTEAANAFAATYAYNDAGRFTAARETAAPLPGSDVKPRDVTYRYASEDPEQVTALMTSTGPFAEYNYDEAGNQIARSYVQTGESWQFVYDGNNDLRRAIKKQFGVTVGSEEYWYDDAGARQIIVKHNAFGAKTELRWFIGNVEAHYTEAGDIERVYSYIAQGTPIARVERTPAGSSLEYQFHGLADNMLAAVDQTTSAVNASFVYAPFGEIIEATDAGGSVGLSAHRRRMNDKYVDEATSLAYYGFRYYDNLTMTWTQSDPLYRFQPDAAWTAPRRASLYAFTLNNPVRLIDPDGRQVFDDITKPAFNMTNLTAKEFPSSLRPVDPKPHVTPAQQDAAGRIASAGLRIAATTLVVGVGVLAAQAAMVPEVELTALDAEASAAADEGTTVASDGAAGASQSGQLVYRGGSGTDDNLTPRPGKDTDASNPKRGLSTFTTLEKATKPGQKAQVIDTSKLKSLCVHCTPDGHVSIRPKTQKELEAWAKTRGTGEVHPLTKEVQDAVVDEVKRPK